MSVAFFEFDGECARKKRWVVKTSIPKNIPE